jgi:zinc transporter ZupT
MFIFALATPLGAIFALALLRNMDEVMVAVALGVSAGTFLFISISDLLPTVYEEHEKGFKNLLSFCLGIFVMILSKGLI